VIRIRKGISQTIWLIVFIVIALATALVLIIAVSKTTTETGEEGKDIITETGSGTVNMIRIANCRSQCTSCCASGGSDCESMKCEYENEEGEEFTVPGWDGCSCKSR